MKYNKILRTLSLAAIFALLLVVTPATPALAAPIITLSPPSGSIGTKVTISLYSFTPGASVRIYFPDKNTLIRTITTDTKGDFSTTFTIDECPAGNQEVWAYDIAVGSWHYDIFRVDPEIDLDKLSGYVSAEIKVSGTGFAANSDITIYFAGEDVGTAETDENGSFSAVTFIVPESYRGRHTVKVMDEDANYDIVSFTTKQSITITPTSGAVNDRVAVSGTGFKARKSITIYFADIEVTTTDTDEYGSFSGSFNVPSRASGTYKYNVEASDGTYSDSADFTISASVSLSQGKGYIGTKIVVSGTGFKASGLITITFADIQVGSVTTDANGSFSGRFLVPTCASGTYKVKVSDGVNTNDADFTILISASLSPATSQASPGYVGIELTISGIGFKPNGTVTIKYDDTQVATTTADSTGAFSATFKVPASQHGDHNITASDGINTIPFTFTMDSTPPPAPALLLPKDNSKAEAEVYFDWKDVDDPSQPVTYIFQIASNKDFTTIVLEKKDLTKSEYTITEEKKLEPTKKEAPYYWRVRAIDGAANEDEWSTPSSFYVGFAFEMPGWALYTLIGLGVLLLGFLCFWFGRRTTYYS